MLTGLALFAVDLEPGAAFGFATFGGTLAIDGASRLRPGHEGGLKLRDPLVVLTLLAAAGAAGAVADARGGPPLAVGAIAAVVGLTAARLVQDLRRPVPRLTRTDR